MLNSFSLLSMQTDADGKQMVKLGIGAEKILTLGNLKYDLDTAPASSTTLDCSNLGIGTGQKILACGSTHPGEEHILFEAFVRLSGDHDLFLILAPRDISRGRELIALAKQYRLEACRRQSRITGGNVLILDTLGELASCYCLADLAFVGGSLVGEGGHNPIEPAACSVPVLFGPHMEDFSEIAADLLSCGGAATVTADTFVDIAGRLLDSDDLHRAMAQNAGNLVRKHRGGVDEHLRVIRQLLDY
jgi:3-deoxy-D-manno-octulosonic-acid transferase